MKSRFYRVYDGVRVQLLCVTTERKIFHMRVRFNASRKFITFDVDFKSYIADGVGVAIYTLCVATERFCFYTIYRTRPRCIPI